MLTQPSSPSPSSLQEPLEDILFKLRFHTALEDWLVPQSLEPWLQQLIPYLHVDPRCRGVLMEMLEWHEYDSSFPDKVAEFLLEHFPEDLGVGRWIKIFGLTSYGVDGMVSDSVHRLCYRHRRDDAFWLACAVQGSMDSCQVSRRCCAAAMDHRDTCRVIVDYEVAQGNLSLVPSWAARVRHWDKTPVPAWLRDKLQAFDLKRGPGGVVGVQPPDSSTKHTKESLPWWLKNERRCPPEWKVAVSLVQLFERVALRISPDLESLLVLAQVDQSTQSRDYLLDEWQKQDAKSEGARLLALILAWKFGNDPAIASALSEVRTLQTYCDRVEPLKIHFADPAFSKCSRDDELWEPLMDSLHHARGDELHRFLNTTARLILRFGQQDRTRLELIRRLKASGVDNVILSLKALALCWPDHPETREMVETAIYSPVESIQDVAARILGRLYIGDDWADTLLRSALMESSEFLAEYMVRNLGKEEVVDEAFALMERLPDQWERSYLYESAPQSVIAFFGPRYDLLDRLAVLMKRTPHKQMKVTIADLLNTYSSQCEHGGLVSPWEECRLRAITAQRPAVAQDVLVPRLKEMAQTDPFVEVRMAALGNLLSRDETKAFALEVVEDPVLEVRLAALGSLLSRDETKAFALEVVEELVRGGEFKAIRLLCSAKAGDEALAAWLTSFSPGSPFTSPCPELIHLLKTYFLRTTATRDYTTAQLRKDLTTQERNDHVSLMWRITW